MTSTAGPGVTRKWSVWDKTLSRAPLALSARHPHGCAMAD